MGCQSGFKFPFSGGTCADFDDVFVRKDFFSEGGLWLWGNNTYGKLGINSIVSVSSPVQTVSGGTNWKVASVGRYHTSAIKTDGSLWLWGCNGYGRLGNNNTTTQSSPVQTVSAGTNWRQSSMGYRQSAAIKTDGSLWMWGVGSNGILGNNTVTSVSSPVQTIAGGNNWQQVSTGGNHTGAIKTDGTLWLWGFGNYGILGNNTVANRSSPAQTVSAGTNWQLVSAGYRHTAAVKTDGTLWLWGLGSCGILGNNTVTSVSSPVQTVSAGTNWKQVSLSDYHTAAVKTDGTLWLWGRNHCGQLGTNSIVAVSSPVQTVSGGTNWKQVSVSLTTTQSAAVKNDSTLWLWGDNYSGVLGTNSSVTRSSPVQTITGGTNWKVISAGTTMVAIREDCW